jgi:hypothetical protein
MNLSATTSAHRAARLVLAALMLWPVNVLTRCCCTMARAEDLTFITCQHPCDCCCSRSEQQRSSSCCVKLDNAGSPHCSAECYVDCDCRLVAAAPRLFDSRCVTDELRRQEWMAYTGCGAAITPRAKLTELCRKARPSGNSTTHNLQQAMLCVWQN